MFNQISQENPFAQHSSSEEADVISISKEKEQNLEEKIQNLPQNERKINNLFGGIKRFSDQTQSLVSLKFNQEKERENLLYSSPFSKMTNFQSVIIARENSNGQKTWSKGRRGHAPIQGQINTYSFKNQQKSSSIQNKNFLNESQINKLKNQTSNIDVLNPDYQFNDEYLRVQSQRTLSQHSSKLYDDAAGRKSDFMKSIEASLTKLQFVQTKNYIERDRKNKSVKKISQNSIDEIEISQQKIPNNIHIFDDKSKKIENISDIDESNTKYIKESKYDTRKIQNLNSLKKENLQNKDFKVQDEIKIKQKKVEQTKMPDISAIEEAIQLRFNQKYEDELPVPAILNKNQMSYPKQNKLNNYLIQYNLQEPIYDKISHNILKDFNKNSINQIEKKVVGFDQKQLQYLQKKHEFFSVFKQQNLLKQESYSDESFIDKNDQNQKKGNDKELLKLKQMMIQTMKKQNSNLIQQIVKCLKQSNQHIKMKKQFLLNAFITYCAIKIQKVFRGNFQRKYIYQFRKQLKTTKNFNKLLSIILGWKTRRIFQLQVVINKCLKIKDHDNQKLSETFQKEQIKKSKQNLIKNMINFINSLLLNEGQWLMLFRNEIKNQQVQNYMIPQNKEEEEQILQQLKQKYSIVRRSHLQQKPSQKNKIQFENIEKKRHVSNEFYSYKNDKKKQEQMENYLKRINYQPRLQAEENKKIDEQYNSNFFISENGEIQYQQNTEEKFTIQRSLTAKKQSAQTFSRQFQQVSSSKNKFEYLKSRVSLSQQKVNQRFSYSNKFIVREPNLQARESLKKRNSYIPDLKKRFVVEIEQKIKEESNPQTFLKKYIQRKQIRQSYPDPIEQNKQLSVNQSVKYMQNIPQKIKSKQLFQRSQSSKLMEQQNLLKPTNKLKVLHESCIQNKYVNQNLRNSFQAKSKKIFTEQYKVQNNYIIDIEIQKYKQRKELRNTQKDDLNKNSQYSVKINDILKYSNQLTSLQQLTIEDGPKDSFKNQYASQHKINFYDFEADKKLVNKKNESFELKTQLKQQQQKLKVSQNETNQMMNEILASNYEIKIEQHQIRNSQLNQNLKYNYTQNQQNGSKISRNSNDFSNSSLKNPYVNLGYQKKEKSQSQIIEKSEQNIDQQQLLIINNYEEQCQPIKPYVKKQSRQTIDKDSNSKDPQAFNRSILQQLSPQNFNEDSQSFEFNINQINSKQNSDHKSSILNRTLKSEFKRENDESFGFKMEKISALQSINFKSEYKSPNEESFALRLEKLSGLQSLQNKGSIFNQSNYRQQENENDESFGINLQQINNESRQASVNLNQSPISYVPSRYLITSSPDKESFSFNVREVDDLNFEKNKSINLENNLNQDHDVQLKQNNINNYDSNQTFNKNQNNKDNDLISHKKNDSEFTLGQESQRKDEYISNTNEVYLQLNQISNNSNNKQDNFQIDQIQLNVEQQKIDNEQSQNQVYSYKEDTLENQMFNEIQRQQMITKQEIINQNVRQDIHEDKNISSNPYLNKYVYKNRQVSQNTNISNNSSQESQSKNNINIFNTKNQILLQQEKDDEINKKQNHRIFENLIKLNTFKQSNINSSSGSYQDQLLNNGKDQTQEHNINNSILKNQQQSELFQVLNLEGNEQQMSTKVNSQNSSNVIQNKQQGKLKQTLKPYQQKNLNIKNMFAKNETSQKNFLAKIKQFNYSEKKEIYKNPYQQFQIQQKIQEELRTKSIKESKKILKSQQQLEIIFNNKKQAQKEQQGIPISTKDKNKQMTQKRSPQINKLSNKQLIQKQTENKNEALSEAQQSLTVDETIQQIRARIQERLSSLNMQKDEKVAGDRERSQDSNFKIQIFKMKDQ